MKRIALALAALTMIAAGPVKAATVLTFDEVVVENIISDPSKNLYPGVTLLGGMILRQDMIPSFFATPYSGSNMMVNSNDEAAGAFRFIFDEPVSTVGMYITHTKSLVFEAYSETGYLGGQEFPYANTVVGGFEPPNWYIFFTFPGLIKRIQLVNGDFGGMAIDNLTIEGGAFGSAVPEPATWALLILGFGAIGARMRSRKNRLSAQAA